MLDRHAIPLLLSGLGLALVAGFGLGLELGPPTVLTAVVFVGVVLVLVAQHGMVRLPEEEREDAPSG